MGFGTSREKAAKVEFDIIIISEVVDVVPRVVVVVIVVVVAVVVVMTEEAVIGAGTDVVVEVVDCGEETFVPDSLSTAVV